MKPRGPVSKTLIIALWALAVIIPMRANEQTASAEPLDPGLYCDRMAHFLSRAQQFQTTARMGYDVVQESGRKIEFSERHGITIARPDRLRKTWSMTPAIGSADFTFTPPAGTERIPFLVAIPRDLPQENRQGGY